MNLPFIAAVATGASLGGFVQGLSGFGFGLSAMTVWAWAVTPQLAGPMVVFGSWVCQLLGVAALAPQLVWKRCVPFIAGGLLGVPFGALLLPDINVHVFRGFVGLLLVCYCSCMLLARRLPTVAWGGSWMDGAVGSLGGFMGGLSGLTGPAPTLWCTLRNWDKPTQRAVFQSFNLSMQTLTLVVYTAGGTLRASMVPQFALMVPVVILPVLAGVRVYRRFSLHGFRRLVLLLLLASGTAMLISFCLHWSA